MTKAEEFAIKCDGASGQMSRLIRLAGIGDGSNWLPDMADEFRRLDQKVKELERQLEEARVDALEEARKACVEYEVPTEVLGAHPDYLEGKHMQKAQCAVAIEALKGKP